MTEPTGPDPRPTSSDLSDLESRLARARGNARPDKDESQETDAGLLGMAWRLSTDFLAAVVVGLGLGWTLDRFASTAPWGIVGGLVLGSAAGIRQVFVTAAKMDAAENSNPGVTGKMGD